MRWLLLAVAALVVAALAPPARADVVASAAPCGTVTGEVPRGQPEVYVSAAGRDGNPGTAKLPYATIRRAMRGIAGGTVVVLLPGTYDEDVLIAAAGRPGACTTLMGMPGAALPVLTSANPGATISVEASYTRLSRLAVTNTATGSAIQASGSRRTVQVGGVLRPLVHHVQIDNVVAYGAGCGGIGSNGTDYTLIWRNTAYGNGYSAKNQCSGISLYEDVALDARPGYHNVIADNVSCGNWNKVPVPGTSHTTDGNGIIIDDFRRTQSDHVPYPAATLVIGNFVYDNGGRGIHVYQSDRVDVVNNTVSGDSLDPLLSSVAELSVASSSQVRLINNIVSARGARFPAVSARASSGPATDNMWEGNLVAVGRVAIAGGGMAAGPGNLVGVAAGFAKNAAQLAFPAAFALARTSPAVLSGVPLAMAVVDRAGHAVAAGQAVNRGADMLPE